MNLPLIDMSGLSASHPLATQEKVAATLGEAARNVGFFYVTGHGIEVSALAAMFDAAHRLFALPAEEKNALSIGRSMSNRGYVRLSDEQLDPASGMADHKEAYNVGLELAADDPDLQDASRLRGVNQWPPIDGWRDEVLAIYERLLGVGRLLHRGFALNLDLPAGYFEPMLDKPLATLRMLRYPPLAPGVEPRLGAGAHTDYGNLTLLATDTVGGLQIRRRDGVWIDAPHVPGALISNIGDCLMRWSNDVYVSTPHRVASPNAIRYSIAFFLDANPDALVECLPSCRSAQRPARYPPITSAQYLKSRLDATYASRARPRGA